MSDEMDLPPRGTPAREAIDLVLAKHGVMVCRRCGAPPYPTIWLFIADVYNGPPSEYVDGDTFCDACHPPEAVKWATDPAAERKSKLEAVFVSRPWTLVESGLSLDPTDRAELRKRLLELGE